MNKSLIYKIISEIFWHFIGGAIVIGCVLAAALVV